MNKSKRMRKGKINKTKVLEGLAIVLVVIAVFVGTNIYQNRTFDAKLVNSQTVTEEQLTNKDETIKNLENQINELKQTQNDLLNKQTELLNKQTELENKNKELQEQVEAVKVSKAKKQTTVTSRGSSTPRTVEASAQPVSSNEKWIWANVSAYCSCAKCCGKTNGITASGTTATAGRTIAAPSNYSFGTKIELEGLGTYTVEDRGGAIKGNKIDVYMDSHQAALNFGRKQVRMRVIQ